MNDPLNTIVRVVMLLFVPAMLLTPLVIAACAPMRVRGDAERLVARSRLVALAIGTLVALGIWAGLLLASLRMPAGPLPFMAQFAWVLFFPLWFWLGLSAIRARNTVWSGALDGSMATSSPVRTASLANRPRENPISLRMWMVAAAIVLSLLAGMALRGFWPFENTVDGQASFEFRRWIMAMSVYAFCALTTFVAAPISIARMHVEPEPLDPHGSSELIDLYRTQRRRKAHGLFWLLVVVLPGFLGAMMLASLWLPPGHGSTIGIIGGIGGSIIGVAGGVFGSMMALQRVRIAETMERLRRASSSAT